MTTIEWTQRPGTKGESWNPIRARNKATGGVGHYCVHKSAGCKNCYAERFQPRVHNPIRYAAQDRDKVERLTAALLPLARKRIPKVRTYNAGAFSFLFSEIDDARAALSASPAAIPAQSGDGRADTPEAAPKKFCNHPACGIWFPDDGPTCTRYADSDCALRKRDETV